MASRRPIGELVIEVGLDSANFNNSLKGITSELKVATNSMKANISTLEAAGDEYGALEAKVEGLNRIMDTNDRKIEELQRQHRAAIETYGAESEQVQKLSVQISNSVRQQAAWQQQLQRTGDRIEKLARETAESESKIIKFGQGMQDTSTKVDALGNRINTTLTPAIAGIGAAAGKAAFDMDTATANIQNSLGLTEKQAEQTAETMQNVWSSGFGEDMGEVSNAIIQVKQNIRGLDDGALENVTRNALAMGQTWDADVNEVTRSSYNIMKNFGISADEAMDLLAKGGQKGLNFSNELFDNVSEYAPLWSKMGYSASEMFSTLNAGVEEGVYNLDYVNDIMKEFQIRVKDGSKGTSDAMALLSKSTQTIWKDFQSGKGTVKDVSNAVLKELGSMDDQVLANQIGVGLYGTKFEDLESDAVYALGSVTDSFKDVDGTASSVADNLEETFSYKFKKTLRETGAALQPLGDTMLDLANIALPAVEESAEFIGDTLDGMSVGAKKTTLAIGAGVIAFGLLAKAIAPILNIAGSLTKKVGRNTLTLDAETLALIANTKAQAANANARNRNGGGTGGNSGSGGNRNGNNNPNNRNNGNRDSDNNQNNRNNGNDTRNNNRNNSDNDNNRNQNNTDGNSGGSGKTKIGKLSKIAKVGGIAGLALGGWSIYDAIKTEGSNKGAAVGGAVGSTGGGAAGATLGAALGSVVPGLGTAIGGIAGGIIGSVAGDAIGKKIGNSYDKNKNENKVNAQIEKGAKLNLDVKGVSKGTQEALNAFEKLRSQSQRKLDSIYASNRTITTGIATVMTTNYNKMANSSIASLQMKQKKERDLAVSALNSNKKLSVQERQQALAELDKKHASERSKLNNANERIKNIILKAKNSKRALTAQEKAEIEKLTNQMNNAKVRSASKSEKEATTILRAQKNQRNSVRTQELNQVITNANKQYKAVVSKAKKEEADVVASAKSKYRKKVEQAKIQYETLGTITKKEYEKIVTSAKKEKEETIKHAETKRKDKIAKAKDQKEQVTNHAQKERDKVVSAAKDERKKSVKESEKQASGIASVWSKLTGSLDKAVNWFKKLFGNDTSNPSIPKIDTNIQAPAAYAKGTYNGRHRGGTALVGEEGRELAHIPGVGMTMLGSGGPQLLDLPRGTAVLPHDKTEATMRSYGFPAYAKGTGDDSWFGKVTASIKDGTAYLKGKAVDAFEWATDSGSKLFDKMTSAFGVSQNVGSAIDKTLIGTTPYKYLKNMAQDFLKGIADNLGGYYDWDGTLEKDPMKVGAGGGRSGLMSYVDNILKDIQSKFNVSSFGGFSDRNVVGGSSKSMHAYGRAVDIFASSSEMQKIADYVKKHPLSQYTIYNRKYSKNGGSWKPYMTSPGRNPHTDHVHADFIPPTNVGSSGAGVQQWRAVAVQALKHTGDYSEANLNALLRRMNQESTGNARSINLWDKNAKKGTPSKGLMQVIDPTFATYRDKTLSSDIYNPLANIVASINYTKKRYGSLIGGWGRKGGYADGGLVTRHQIAEIAEGNKPEMIIPLDRAKRGRALQLLAKAQKYLGAEGNKDSSTVSASSNSKIIGMMAEQINLLNQQVALLAQIVTKDTAIVIDGKTIATSVNKANNTINRMTNRARGVNS